MGIRFKIVPEHHVVVIVQVGHISQEKKISFYKALIEDSRMETGYVFLVDYTNAESEVVSSDDVKCLAEFSKKWDMTYHMRGKTAIIATGDIVYGMTRMYQAYADSDENHQVFRDAQTAVDWLGIQMSVLEEVRNNTKEVFG